MVCTCNREEALNIEQLVGGLTASSPYNSSGYTRIFADIVLNHRSHIGHQYRSSTHLVKPIHELLDTLQPRLFPIPTVSQQLLQSAGHEQHRIATSLVHPPDRFRKFFHLLPVMWPLRLLQLSEALEVVLAHAFDGIGNGQSGVLHLLAAASCEHKHNHARIARGVGTGRGGTQPCAVSITRVFAPSRSR